MAHQAPICPYCGTLGVLCTGLDVYPHRRDLWRKKFWRCPSCPDVWVGCHPPAVDGKGGGQGDGTVPLGRLADGALRSAKQQAHAAFDPLWKGGPMKRRQAYAWLAKELGIPGEDCHIGMFEADLCMRVIEAVARFNATRKDGGNATSLRGRH